MGRENLARITSKKVRGLLMLILFLKHVAMIGVLFGQLAWAPIQPVLAGPDKTQPEIAHSDLQKTAKDNNQSVQGEKSANPIFQSTLQADLAMKNGKKVHVYLYAPDEEVWSEQAPSCVANEGDTLRTGSYAFYLQPGDNLNPVKQDVAPFGDEKMEFNDNRSMLEVLHNHGDWPSDLLIVRQYGSCSGSINAILGLSQDGKRLIHYKFKLNGQLNDNLFSTPVEQLNSGLMQTASYNNAEGVYRVITWQLDKKHDILVPVKADNETEPKKQIESLTAVIIPLGNPQPKPLKPVDEKFEQVAQKILVWLKKAQAYDNHPNSDELWRPSIQLYIKYTDGQTDIVEPLCTLDKKSGQPICNDPQGGIVFYPNNDKPIYLSSPDLAAWLNSGWRQDLSF